MAPQAVVLDLDGTVWDSRPWYAHLAGRGDRDRVSRVLAELEAGRPAATILRAAGYTPTRFRDACRSIDPPFVCLPGIIGALEYLRDGGVKLGAATNLPAWVAEPMADVSGLATLLDALVGYTATRRHKPHPDPVIEALRRLNAVPGSLAWYVGDEDQDSAAAHAAGVHFAWASWGASPKAPEGTNLVLRRPTDLANLASLTLEQA